MTKKAWKNKEREYNDEESVKESFLFLVNQVKILNKIVWLI